MVLNKLGVNQFTTLNYSKEMTGKWKNTVISNNNEWGWVGPLQLPVPNGVNLHHNSDFKEHKYYSLLYY